MYVHVYCIILHGQVSPSQALRQDTVLQWRELLQPGVQGHTEAAIVVFMVILNERYFWTKLEFLFPVSDINETSTYYTDIEEQLSMRRRARAIFHHFYHWLLLVFHEQ